MKIDITGASGTQVVLIPNGPPGQAFSTAYGSFYDVTTQTNDASSNTVTFSDTAMDAGVALVDGDTIVPSLDGIYNLELSIVAAKASGGHADVDVWPTINGTPIPDANTRGSVSGNGAHVVMAWNLYMALEANDEIQLRWWSDNAATTLQAYTNLTNPVRPDIPSVIVTMMRIADLP